MANTIARRIYDFLKEFPPFSLLQGERVEQIARRVVVQYRRPDEVVFRQGEEPGAYIYMVREGAVRLFHEEGERRILIDQCDEGDLFGVRPLLVEENYAFTAEVVEESLLYAIPVEGFEEILDEEPKVAYYFASIFASGWPNHFSKKFQGRLFLDRERMIDDHLELVEVQSLEHSKTPVTCPPSDTIQQAAQTMSRKEVGSIIIVDADRCPLGILTDKDLRRRVATGLAPLTDPVTSIMSSPVVTMPPTVTVADVQMQMVKRRIHHLCLTEDGTDKSPVVGVISEHDILVVQANNPVNLIREINRSGSGEALRQIRKRAEELLKKYLYQEVSISFISSVITEVNDALMQRAVELGMEGMAIQGNPVPEVDFCWLALGSAGRKEQLLATDQDNALVFEDVDGEALEAVRTAFLELARRVTITLHDIGFEYCPAGMMAVNPKWCLSLPEWKRQFGEWIHEPTPEAVMHGNIFFDYRPLYGQKALADTLTEFIYKNLDSQSVFLSFMAKNALKNPPPLTFFRNFMVEKSGDHKDAFDIKARAIMPLADAARVLILQARIPGINNSIRRLEKMAELEPQNREVYQDAAEAYEILLRYRTMQGLKHGDSGRYFKPSELSKMERLNLRNSFRPIRALQSLLSTRFQTAYFG
jgi:CBS domain-containing protein